MYNSHTVHACMCQEVYLQEEYFPKINNWNFPSLDHTIPGMETVRPVTNIISSTEGQNLADSLASKEMADKFNSALRRWSKGYRFISCQYTVDDSTLFCRVFDKAIWLHWPSVCTKWLTHYMASAPFSQHQVSFVAYTLQTWASWPSGILLVQQHKSRSGQFGSESKHLSKTLLLCNS